MVSVPSGRSSLNDPYRNRIVTSAGLVTRRCPGLLAIFLTVIFGRASTVIVMVPGVR